MPSSRAYPQFRDWTHISYISYIGKWVLYHQRHLGSLLHAVPVSYLCCCEQGRSYKSIRAGCPAYCPNWSQRKLCRKWRFLELMVCQPEALSWEPDALCWGVLNASAWLSVMAVKTMKMFPCYVFCFHICSAPPGALLQARLAFPAGSTVQSSLRQLVPNSVSRLISSPTSGRHKRSYGFRELLPWVLSLVLAMIIFFFNLRHFYVNKIISVSKRDN